MEDHAEFEKRYPRRASAQLRPYRTACALDRPLYVCDGYLVLLWLELRSRLTTT